MITVIHGDDIFSSRNYLLNEKNKKIPNITLDGKNLDLSTVAQVIDSDDFFSKKPHIFIESLFSEKKGRELDNIINYLIKKQFLAELILWENNEIPKKYLDVFKNAKINLFKHSSSIFTFLDAISPKNGKNLIIIFHKILNNSTPEQIIYMLIRQFRLFLALKDNNSSDIDEIKKLLNWQKLKIKRQANLFSYDLLKKIYFKLFQIDCQYKTGALKTSLIQAIDFLLLDI